MGKLIEFPISSIIRKPDVVGGFQIVEEEIEGDYQFPNNPAAKSTTFVMQAAVCQTCGCKRDGKLESMKAGCKCLCHKGEH